MSFIIRAEDGIAPADFQLDFHDAPYIVDHMEPAHWLSFAFWVHTADVAANGFTMDVNYLDPTGQNRVINGTPISLADSTAFFSSTVQMVVRQNVSSAWTIDADLIGSAGTALISYRILLTYGLDEQATIWTP